MAVGAGASAAGVAVGAGPSAAGVAMGAGASAAGVSVGAGTVDVADEPQAKRNTRTNIPAASTRFREFLNKLYIMLGLTIRPVGIIFLVAPIESTLNIAIQVDKL